MDVCLLLFLLSYWWGLGPMGAEPRGAWGPGLAGLGDEAPGGGGPAGHRPSAAGKREGIEGPVTTP